MDLFTVNGVTVKGVKASYRCDKCNGNITVITGSSPNHPSAFECKTCGEHYWVSFPGHNMHDVRMAKISTSDLLAMKRNGSRQRCCSVGEP